MDSSNSEPIYKLFLHMIGGHCLIINSNDGKILKTTNQKEIDFYEFLNNSEGYESLKSCIPKYYGRIKKEKDSKQYQRILSFIRNCDKFFQNLIIQTNLDINIENDSEFKEKLESFKNEKLYTEEVLEESDFEYLINYLKEINESKLRWFLFWYTKWRKTFFVNDFIILEDLTYKFEYPAILDIKIGNFPKRSKKDQQIKVFPASSVDLGFRLMGLQVFYLILKLVF
jgi:hypothetical protein